MAATHQAAVLPAAGSPLIVVDRDTPAPGPGEILIEVKAIALNPMDNFQRDFGLPAPMIFPAVLGCDVTGVVAKVGPDVPPDAPTIGSRVLALATSYYHDGLADYGAYQQFTLTRTECVTPLPDDMSFEQGAVLPVVSLTALSAYTTLGMPITTKFKPADKQAILIWGGSSSVGSLAVQTAKVLGFTVYATAGPKNLDYVKSLGADSVFDYKTADVVSQIVKTAEQDGVDLHTAHVAVPNALHQTVDVLQQTRGSKAAKIAHAPLLPDDTPTLEDVEIKFTYPPIDPAERQKHKRECFTVWLDQALKAGTVVSSPKVEVMPGGLAGLNAALDKLKGGVSSTKLVVSL